MQNLTHLAKALQTLLTTTALTLALQTGFTTRVGAQLTGPAFAQTLLFGFLAKPSASLNRLSATAESAKAQISSQGLDQRFSEKSANFLQSLLKQALQLVVTAQPQAIGLLQRFSGVYVLDSTIIMLPDSLAQVWAGCGGRVKKNNQAALKFNLLAELNTGGWQALSWMKGRAQDRASDEAQANLPEGSLRLADLGYFNLKQFKCYSQAGVYWLSRLRFGTSLFDHKGVKSQLEPLLKHYAKKGLSQLDLEVELGVKERVAARLVAVRVPKGVAALRRSRLRKEWKREGKPVRRERLYLAQWTFYVTNLPVEKADLSEILVLGRVRWQVEQIFKLWKSEGLVGEWRTNKPWRILTELYAKLLGVLVSHWVMLLSGMGSLEHSQVKAYQLIGQKAQHLLSVLEQLEDLEAVLNQLKGILMRHCQRTKRGKALSLFQLLQS